MTWVLALAPSSTSTFLFQSISFIFHFSQKYQVTAEQQKHCTRQRLQQSPTVQLDQMMQVEQQRETQQGEEEEVSTGTRF